MCSTFSIMIGGNDPPDRSMLANKSRIANAHNTKVHSFAQNKVNVCLITVENVGPKCSHVSAIFFSITGSLA